ncbi:hypothetical protein SAMN05428949_6757 [Chitinophaga sp. YR627]|nr:hypothetical protein SAMN05428949_6757 [Chitinophaga sp. YR627]
MFFYILAADITYISLVNFISQWLPKNRAVVFTAQINIGFYVRTEIFIR